MKSLENKWVIGALVVLLYVGSRLIFLTKLPVFADEAIYIRWSQVGQSQPEQYLFLSMLDGKPPLHNWLIGPFRQLVQDPLLASRLLSVVAGGVTFLYLFSLIMLLTKSKRLATLAVILSIFSPFFLMNQRMGLAESLLTMFFTAGLYHGLRILGAKERIEVINHTLLFGLSWGLSLWTKTNAIFFILPFALLPFLYKKTTSQSYFPNVFFVVLGGIVGGLLFTSLKHSPLFPSLFSRSQDYTFTIKELFGGEWKYVLFSSLPKVTSWIAWYSVPLLLIVPFFEKRINKIVFLMIISYMAPLVAMGRILSSRYFLPVAPLLILAIIFGLKEMEKKVVSKKISKLILGVSIAWASIFALVHIGYPDKTWYTKPDRRQYLEDWSSGHGIPEVRDFIKERVKDHQVVVATEGFFGTLPDGLMMYFHGTKEITNLELYGIGQPIAHIPSDLFEKAKIKEVYVVVNDHRFLMPLTPQIQKIGEFTRPNNAPSLLLLKINPS